jgi:hypothetical protein
MQMEQLIQVVVRVVETMLQLVVLVEQVDPV